MVTPGSKKESKPWVPDRQDIIWIDCNPQAGREMRDIHPFLVLSPCNFNDKTSLVIGLPMTTAEYNADNPLNELKQFLFPEDDIKEKTLDELLVNIYEAVEGCLSVDVRDVRVTEKGKVLEIAV